MAQVIEPLLQRKGGLGCQNIFFESTFLNICTIKRVPVTQALKGSWGGWDTGSNDLPCA